MSCGATAETLLDVAWKNVCYYTVDADGPQYASVEVALDVECGICKGYGRRLKPRTKHTYIDCKHCDHGYLPIVGWTRISAAEVQP